MPYELKDLQADVKTTWEEMKHLLSQREEEIKKLGFETQETKNALDAANKRIDEQEVKMQRPQMSANPNEVKERKRAVFSEFLRYGFKSLTEEERKELNVFTPERGEAKALSISDQSLGGFLAPPEYVDAIIKPSLLYSPIRSYARVISTTSGRVQMPVRKGTFAAKWVSETGARSETAGLKYGIEEITAQEMYAEVLISNQLLEDSAFNMDEQIQMEAAEQFGITEGAGFVNGTGSGQPEGVMTNTSINVTNSGNASALTYAGMVTQFTALSSPYVPNARWALNRNTIGAIRQIVDSQGRPIWDIGTPAVNAGLVNGFAPSILGVPYFEATDMPTVGAGTYPIIFGDFYRGYVIVDRIAMSVQRLVEKYAESGQTAYIIRKRVGGGIVLPQAFTKQLVHV